MDHRVPAGRRYGAAYLIFTLALVAPTVVFAGPAAAAMPVARSAPLTVPVSILDLMRASVEIPADGIWAAQGAEKLDDDDWLLADEDSVSPAIPSIQRENRPSGHATDK